MRQLKKLVKEYLERRKQQKEQALWYSHGSACFRLFPPSLYSKLSEEELFQLREEELGKLRKILREYKKKAG